MAVPTTGPIPWANRLNKLLNQFHQIHGGDRFPVDVETLALQIPTQFQTGEPIVVEGQDIDPEFEGALFNLNAGSQTKGSWAIVYNQSITSLGRIRFTLAHELGHYLLHRKVQEAFNCSEADMLHWDSPERQLEVQADLFASYLLMPIDDFREQITGKIVDLDVLGSCASLWCVVDCRSAEMAGMHTTASRVGRIGWWQDYVVAIQRICIKIEGVHNAVTK